MWHDQDIAEIGDAGAVEVILCEAFYDAVGIMVTGTPVPAFIDIGGSDLYGAKGNAGAKENMAMCARSDIGVYIRKRGAFFWRGLGGEGEDGERKRKNIYPFHEPKIAKKMCKNAAKFDAPKSDKTLKP